MLGSSPTKSPKQLRSVILIDDNNDDNFIHRRQILRSGIVPNGDCIHIANGGEQALEYLMDLEPSTNENWEEIPQALVFLDINMPRMNGFEFLEKFESLKETQNLPSIILLMLTSSNSEHDQQKAKNFQTIKGFHTKPITEKALVEIVETYFK